MERRAACGGLRHHRGFSVAAWLYGPGGDDGAAAQYLSVGRHCAGGAFVSGGGGDTFFL